MSVHRLRTVVIAVIAAIIANPLAANSARAAEHRDNVPLVAVTAIVRDASIDALYTGMTDTLREAGFRDGDSVRLRFESAQADAARAAQLVKSFTADRADIIVAITGPSVRIAAKEKLRVPLVIAGVDPATADELRRSRSVRLLSGVIDGARYDTQLALIREIAPTVRSLAVPIDADNPSGDDALQLMKSSARTIDLNVETLPISLEREVIAAAIESYVPDETAIFLDKRIFPDAPVERIIAAAETSNLLVFAGDEDSVVRGALAAIVSDPYGTGRQVGQLVARILKQPSAARTPPQPAEPTYIVINQDTAARIGIEIPGAVLSRRGRSIGWADVGGPRPRGKPAIPEPPPAPEVTNSDEPDGATEDKDR